MFSKLRFSASASVVCTSKTLYALHAFSSFRRVSNNFSNHRCLLDLSIDRQHHKYSFFLSVRQNTITALQRRSMSANKSPNPYNGAPPKYLNDFSKALASEVRILLAEVGKLRDERRQLQFEIAELMAVKSKHGAGGEYSPDWRPKPQEPMPPPPAAATPPPVDDGAPVQARPAWRVVHKPTRRERAPKGLPAPAPAPVPQIEAPKPVSNPNVPAWAQWRPNPALMPSVVPSGPVSPRPATPPARPGLFGPPTPPPK